MFITDEITWFVNRAMFAKTISNFPFSTFKLGLTIFSNFRG
jgi:hypothetical protein